MDNKELNKTPEQVVNEQVVYTKEEVKEVVNTVKPQVKTTVPTTPAPQSKKEEAKKDQKKSTFNNPVVETKQPVKEEPKKEPEVTITADFKVGETVKIKESCKEEVTGRPVPFFAYRNVYKVHKVLDSRVIISAGNLMYAVTKNDIEEA